ncbi:heavy metal-associated isoprenylated plant protein 9 isoform X1 [Magnolia sinica]|uniref:heavy metal-associated isoprenylated plant protein 9 isoform X1 n=1 Tax=Magnolia sinica TaxID=86752 RepID=UPI002659B674|nr:heavy metal-associated isoprenylated plant protein 9 isoform X1 [Magnolia sinica]
MGEAKQEEAKAETKPEEKKEEKAEDKKEEKAEEKAEEKKEEEKAPPSPIVLFVDMHCVGCAKRVERCIMKFRGVEAVEIDMGQNQVTIKGIVEPQALCMKIQKKTKRKARVLSPLPPPEGESKPQVVTSQVGEVTTVVLNVNMHCEACAQQLKSKILKMRGVQTAETELSSSKVTVTGTMDADRLVDYVYRRTRKLAKIVPQPSNEEKAGEEKKPEESPKEAEKPPEEAPKTEEKKEENGEKKEEEKPPEKEENTASEEKPAEAAAVEEEPKKEGEEIPINDDLAKKVMYWPPVYVIEHIPPPQLFSDENPNACCIS